MLVQFHDSKQFHALVKNSKADVTFFNRFQTRFPGSTHAKRNNQRSKCYLRTDDTFRKRLAQQHEQFQFASGQ